MKVVQLDSHQLTSFQRCPQQFFLHYVLGLEPQKRKDFYDKGTLTATLLQIYYQRKLQGKENPLDVYYGNKIIERGVGKLNLPQIDSLLMTQILKEYRKYWKDSDFTPLAVEKGFSKILYQDSSYTFIYEGRPDLITVSDEGERIAVDHKTQGQQKSIYNHNNQAIGYCWAADCIKFVYNYIKWTKDNPFRREPYKFTVEQVESWKLETIGWFKKVAEAKEEGCYLKSLQCQGMYGLCDFTEVCEQPKTEIKEWIIGRSFKERNRKWRAW